MDPRDASLPTGENAECEKPCGMSQIRAGRTVGDAVNKTGDWSWGRKDLAHLIGFELCPTTQATRVEFQENSPKRPKPPRSV